MTVGPLLIFAQIAAVSSTTAAIRFNQLGYLPDAPKVAVLCALTPVDVGELSVTDAAGRKVLQRAAQSAPPFGPCVASYRLDFSSVKAPG